MESFQTIVEIAGLVPACRDIVQIYTGKSPVFAYLKSTGFRDKHDVLWMIADNDQGDGPRIIWGKFTDEDSEFVGSIFGIEAIFDEVCEFARHLELGTLEAYQLKRKDELSCL